MILAPTLAAAGLLALSGAYFWPQLAKAAQIRTLRQQCRATRSLALTYDDGPGRLLTPRLLTVLAEHGVKASFLPTARSASANPDGVAALLAAGHELGCHSAQHLHAWKVAPWRSVADVNDGYAGLAQWLPARALYRPPYGKLNLASSLALRHRGARVAWWTVDSGDTRASLPQPAHVLERVRQAGGGVVLMHDFDRTPPNDGPRAAFVLRVTELLLRAAATEGWRVCSLGQLLQEMP